MCIRCLTWSTWKVRNGEARSAGETTPCCPPPHGSASKVNHSGGDAQVVSCHRYLVVFHPFVEQLTVFHTSGLVLALSSIFRVLDSTLIMPLCDGILSGTCQKVRKLCINPYISIVNPLRTAIHTYKHNLRLRPH